MGSTKAKNMTFKIYQYVRINQEYTGRGQCWRGEVIEEHLRELGLNSTHQTILPTILRLLPKQGRILEAGCGLGRWLIYLRTLGYAMYGMDISDESVKAIHGYEKSIPLCQGDVEIMPFADECFDAIISLGVMEHFEAGPQKALDESYRLLKKQGLLLVTVPYQNLIRKFMYAPFIRLFGIRARLRGLRPQFAEYRFSKDEMVHYIQEAGFEVLLIEADDFTPPKSLGLYADWAWLIGNRHAKWELNTLGRILLRFLSLFPLWLYCSGILLVARKQEKKSKDVTCR